MKIQCYDCFKFYKAETEEDSVCPFCGSRADHNEEQDNILKEGTVLSGRYIIGKKIGQGGFGITYKGWDNHIGRLVAVKEYFPKEGTVREPGKTEVSSVDEKSRKIFRFGMERYINEAKLMVKYISHHNIVDVLDYFEENKTAYIVMEYLDGTGLDRYLKKAPGGKLDQETSLKIILGVCNALRAIHGEGFVHRDISPDNIYICKNGEYKLLDFGAARAAQNSDSASDNITVILKKDYAPPEQYLKNNLQGPWTDIYALGVTYYRMLTGVMPDRSTDRQIKDEIKQPSELDPSIPEYLNDAVMKALELDRKKRFQNVDEFEEAVLNRSAQIPEEPEPEIKEEEKPVVSEAPVTENKPEEPEDKAPVSDEKQCFDCFKFYKNTGDNEECPFCGYRSEPFNSTVNILPEGTELYDGRYVIGRKCGQGGFGITYKAWDRQLEQIVAVKEYFPASIVNRIPGEKNIRLSSSSEKTRKEFQFGMERYINEARIMAKYVSHENIINVYEYFEENKTAYIVMEFLDGTGLDGFLKKLPGKKTDIKTATNITLSICNALKTIHADGIVHRDISPDNIYICRNGKYKLFDFGAARFTKNESTQLTIILKPGYAPPEQYSKTNQQGPWTDIYALGATLYRMLTGKMPDESMNRKINDELAQPSELEPSVPQYLNDAVMKAMALDQHLRFKTVEEFEAAVRQEKKVESVRKTVKRKKRNRIIGICSACAVLAAGAAVVINLTSKPSLPSADINVWYIEGSTSQSSLEDIRTEFNRNFKDINISFTGYGADEYEKALSEARDSGSMPDLFQSDGIDTQQYEVASVRPLVTGKESSDCYFLGENSDLIQQNGKLPLGFNVSVIYINSLKCSYSEYSSSDISDVTDGNVSVDEKMKDILELQFGKTGLSFTGTEEFYSGEADAMFGDTSSFHDVRHALPARSRMIMLDSENIQCRFSECWSISGSSGKDQKAAAEGFLRFMMTSGSQDHLFIRQESDALPVNREAFGEYSKVYSEFEDIMDRADNFVFRFD